MPTAPTRRERPARRNANYRRDPEPPKVFDPASDVSDLESDESETTSEEVDNLKADDNYMSEGSVEEEELEEDIMEDEGLEEDIEEGEEDAEGEDDVDVEIVEGELDEDEIEEELEEEESEEDEEEEPSDFEEETLSKRNRGRARSKSALTQRTGRQQRQSAQSSRSASSRKRSGKADPPLILTKRQRAKYNEEYQHTLLQLPMEPTRKKHLTEEEIALKKSETARRRKHQSIQRAEQDKMDTINRLLKKQNTKRRSKEDENENNQENANNVCNAKKPIVAFHYQQNKDGCTLSVPIGYNLPIRFDKGPIYPQPLPICSFPGCEYPKKYRSTKNYKYACSLEHLKKIEGRA